MNIMRTDKRTLQEGNNHQKKLSARSPDKQLFNSRSAQCLDPFKQQFKKQIRPSLLIQQQQPREPNAGGNDSKNIAPQHSAKKVNELKESVSTNSTIREQGAKARSCRQPTMEGRGLRKEDFIIGAPLGKGKFGSVFVARHKKTGFICALKVINKSKIMKENILHQMIREIKIQSYCDHPSLTKLYGFFTSLDEIFLITEMSSQGQLLQFIQKHKLQQKPIPEPTISTILRQICEGVRYMHTLKIIHRDIKPENIVMERGTVRICDFGWAVNHMSSLRTTFCGTPLYVSPEILKGESYDEKVDLWAVGIMAWEMMYGDIPFDINCQQQLVKIITEDIVFPESPKISAEFRDFVSKILKKNPKERLRIGILLEHPFLQQQV